MRGRGREEVVGVVRLQLGPWGSASGGVWESELLGLADGGEGVWGRGPRARSRCLDGTMGVGCGTACRAGEAGWGGGRCSLLIVESKAFSGLSVVGDV